MDVGTFRWWRTWITSLLFAIVATMIFPVSVLLVRLRTLGPMALIFVVVIILFVRALVGLTGGTRLSHILTEDFGHWTVASLLHRDAWRNAFRSGLEGGVAGLFILSAVGLVGASLFSIYKVVYLLVKGSSVLPDLRDAVAAVFVTPFVVIVLAVFGFVAGFLFGLLMGILRACRQTAKFVSIHSPYQRLRAGIVFNVVQLEVVGWIFSY